jgi:hypothetical protein
MEAAMQIAASGWIRVDGFLADAGIDSIEERRRLMRHGGARFETDGGSALLLPQDALASWLQELRDAGLVDDAALIKHGLIPDFTGLPGLGLEMP